MKNKTTAGVLLFLIVHMFGVSSLALGEGSKVLPYYFLNKIRYDSHREDSVPAPYFRQAEILEDGYYLNYSYQDYRNLKELIDGNGGKDKFLIFPVSEELGVNYTKLLKDSISCYSEKKEDALYRYNIVADILKNNMGKEFASNNNKIMTEYLLMITDYAKKSLIDDRLLIHVASQVSDKDLVKAQADYENGKISKKLKKAFNGLLQYFAYNYNEHDQKLKKFEGITRNSEYLERRAGSPDFPIGKYERVTKVYYDTIPNPMYPEFLKAYLKKYDIYKYLELGYDWFDGESEKVTEKYPHNMTYYRYSERPELRVLTNGYSGYRSDMLAAFDNDGNLVCVNNIPSRDYMTINLADYDNYDVHRQVCRVAWEENKYDIQNATAEIKHEIKVFVELEQKTAAEKAQDDEMSNIRVNAIANYATADSKYKNRRKAEQAQKQAAFTLLGAMLASGPSPEVRNWIDQVALDEKGCFEYKRICDAERIDGCTFRLVYADNNKRPAYEVIWKYYVDEPFGALQQKRTVRRL